MSEPGPGPADRVTLRFADRAALRAHAASGAASGVLARTVEVLLDADPGPLGFVPRPEWPPLRRYRAHRTDDGWRVVVRLGGHVEVAEVLAELGRYAVRPVLDVTEPRPGLTLDDRVFNAEGFGPADGPVAEVAAAEPSERLVADLRAHAGARVSAATAPAVVAALAMAGVPLVGEAPAGLDPALRDQVAAPVDLADPLAREEHSVLLRRAALDAHGPARRQPSVSIVLATKRPDMLDHALRQVAKQRGVDRLELVLAPHGFDPDPAAAQQRAGVPTTVLPQPPEAAFGDVLTSASRAAAGELVLKMDDDDWYGPDFVADLLRARAWSGADVVGTPAEQHYLAPLDLTVTRGHRAEAWTRFVAGGTILLSRDLLREVGWWRQVRRYVDAQLLAAVHAAGGTVYRTSGLGYLLRRNASGHTWEVDLEELLDPARVQQRWEGFRPSRLLSCAPEERPGGA
ncbi:hypothetical protein GGQ22_20660 [Nocardioides sp. zg-579]|uniref:Glycosyltransferase n=1 Tax=Nocardioides marmotae TaxID=2663857 RepID=A0A6I3JHS0_9ACTN|nr:hypothetical protein [Nocardioides marmotae]MCR6033820.1 hypothetical protein [Gordonia jinghuaiqii]MTB97478.1 hypothetical protein [Nocardioides marmotae]QKE03141.1 hypothetical protein HPC71_20310 [Nocardioides marmotae]